MLTSRASPAPCSTYDTAVTETPLITLTMSLRTPITELFGIKHPIMLAGMNVAAGKRSVLP